MKLMKSHTGFSIRIIIRNLIAIICAAILVPGDMSLIAAPPPQETQAKENKAAENAPKIPADQLDSLVAPIALYPDPMLAQTLAASTYPLEMVQLQQWLQKNKNLKDKALVDAVEKQNWDPSVQAMAALPDVVKQLTENVKWMTDLGNAFLAQQDDVMAAVQRMRKKAQDMGNLKSSEQQKVETQVVESKQVIVIQQSNPEVVYVPSYNPTVVYGAPIYPYPPIVYPPPGYYAAGMAISFGVGVAMGAAWGGGWGWGCGWGHGNNNVYINNNNNFVNNSNRNFQGNRTNIQGGNRGSWQHNPQHRGGAPYSDRNTANRYGGTARGDSLSTRQANARQNQSQRTGTAAAGSRQSQAGTRTSGGGGNASGDRVGNRSVSSGSGSRSSSAFSGGSSGFSGSSARSSSSRGSSSMGSRGGGGRRR